MARRVPPLSIREQFGFFWRLLPFVGLLVAVLLFRVWKVVEADDLRAQVFKSTRNCASLDGELQIEQGLYISRTAFGKIEKAGRELGLIWPPDSGRGLIVADPALVAGDRSLQWLSRPRETRP
jgi:hypothetical protein